MKIRIEFDNSKKLSDVTLGDVAKSTAAIPSNALKGLAWVLNKGACALQKATAPVVAKPVTESEGV
jgi:hypothetical protein